MNYQYKRFPLTPSEAQRLADACGTLLEKVLVWTFLDTGLRLSELASLRASMIDWDNHIMLIHGKGGPYGVRSKLRVVPLTPRVTDVLREHFRHADMIGLSPRSIERHIKSIAERAAIPRPVTPHVLRHTFSVHALRRDVPLPVIQKILGHEYLSTTGWYMNLAPEDVIAAFRAKW
jgi:integrase/recombinase XerD